MTLPHGANRARFLNTRSPGPGPVVYWMSRDQRVAGNWALLHAQSLALERRVPLAVVFTLAPAFPGATLRAYDFMLKGLELTESRLAAAKIPFFLLFGAPTDALLRWAAKVRPGLVVTDFDPLRVKRAWRATVAERLAVPLIEVDAHNIVPAWIASPKQEWAAYTFRPKIHRWLADYLTDFPPLERHSFAWTIPVHLVKWDRVIAALNPPPHSAPVSSFVPGEAAAARTMGLFLKKRLDGYAEGRNDPVADAQSEVSPYLHFGQLSAQRLALEVRRRAWESSSGQAYLEELIVRRELADNYCFHNPYYDGIEGFPAWAKATLARHAKDKRPHVYSPEQFENAATHDPLWNAAQTEMVQQGKMHGYMRMYWAKKILEWSPSAEAAMATAIALNDRYELDGRDPNGYAGIAWSIGGVHDRPWFERPIFGQVRWMSAGGCRSKFDVEAYIKKNR